METTYNMFDENLVRVTDRKEREEIKKIKHISYFKNTSKMGLYFQLINLLLHVWSLVAKVSYEIYHCRLIN